MITINGLEPSYSLFQNNEYNVILSSSILKSLERPAEIRSRINEELVL